MDKSKANNQSNTPSAETYQGFAGLPPLVGLETMQEAISKGITIAESVVRLKRLYWGFKRLHNILILRIAAMPIYELKMAFSLHAHYCAEHAMLLAARIREMRQPPYRLEISPDPSLDLFFDEILAAPTVEALVLGFYSRAVPAVVQALDRFLRDTNRLFDHPSYRVCRFALIELQDVQEYGEKAVQCLVNEEHTELSGWLSLLDRMLVAAGGFDGAAKPSGEVIGRQFSEVPYEYDSIPKRDERFKDCYNMGVHAEAMLFDPDIAPLPKTIMLYFKRMREINVPELMSSIIAETSGKPWAYYRDMTRQMWDEARHAMMGEVGLVSLGVDWTEIPMDITFSFSGNTKLSPKERHAVLYAIEQGLMQKKTGKEYEWEVAVAAEPLAARIQDYDWADEVLHAKIGREWLVKEIGSQTEAIDFGNQAWSQMYISWAKWRDEGLTEHRNWWPEIYRQACKHWDVAPDPRILAYNKTYEAPTADLKQYTG